MAVVAVLAGLLVVVLVVAWLSDRRDARGGAGRARGPGALGSELRAGRKEARWKRATTRWYGRGDL